MSNPRFKGVWRNRGDREIQGAVRSRPHPVTLAVHSRPSRGSYSTVNSVSACPRRGLLEPLGALVAEEVVTREYFVDLEALRASIALTDVALQETLVAHHTLPLAVVQEALGDGPPARLTGGMHGFR